MFRYERPQAAGSGSFRLVEWLGADSARSDVR